MRRIGLAFAVVLGIALIAVGACYSATGGRALKTGGVRVRAIDASTARPVAGAVLAAQWQTSAFLCLEGDCPRTIVRTAEALTDRLGVAVIPSTIVPRPGSEIFHPNQPRVIVYKAGYVDDPLRHGTCLLYPLSHDAASNDQGADLMLGEELWQWSPVRFPRLAAAMRTKHP